MPPFVPPSFFVTISTSTRWFYIKKPTNFLLGLDPLLGSEPEQKKTFFHENCSHCSLCTFYLNFHYDTA